MHQAYLDGYANTLTKLGFDKEAQGAALRNLIKILSGKGRTLTEPLASAAGAAPGKFKNLTDIIRGKGRSLATPPLEVGGVFGKHTLSKGYRAPAAETAAKTTETVAKAGPQTAWPLSRKLKWGAGAAGAGGLAYTGHGALQTPPAAPRQQYGNAPTPDLPQQYYGYPGYR